MPKEDVGNLVHECEKDLIQPLPPSGKPNDGVILNEQRTAVQLQLGESFNIYKLDTDLGKEFLKVFQPRRFLEPVRKGLRERGKIRGGVLGAFKLGRYRAHTGSPRLLEGGYVLVLVASSGSKFQTTFPVQSLDLAHLNVNVIGGDEAVLAEESDWGTIEKIGTLPNLLKVFLSILCLDSVSPEDTNSAGSATVPETFQALHQSAPRTRA